MPPIHASSSTKRIATQILVIAKLNEKKYFIFRGFPCDIKRTSKINHCQMCHEEKEKIQKIAEIKL